MRSSLITGIIISQALPLTATSHNASTLETIQSPIPAENYFREYTASIILYVHIALMLLAWVGALPICIMLNIARSNLRYPFHISFLGLHGVGTIFGLAYNSKTPDLYPNNSHRKLGWVLTILIIAHFLVGILRSFTMRERPDESHEFSPFISPDESGMPDSTCDPEQGIRGSSARSIISRSPARSSISHNETDCETLFDDVYPHNNSKLEHRLKEPVSWKQRWTNISNAPFWIGIWDLGYDIVFRFFLPLGFVAVCTGIVTMAGIFHGKNVFNGLAHFIKGGIFFWWGILTLGRWTGCFSSLGWAWNVSKKENHGRISMEAVECSVIFLYGITNVFLEHLTNWGKEWAPQDFEHVAISLLFIGGGLCGLMVESSSTRALPDLKKADYDRYMESDNPIQEETPRSKSPINPIPTLIIFLLGGILGGHHQMSMESTMMHKQFGNNLTATAISRSLTYLFFHISSPISTHPTRPPSELICAFCLMCGGIMLMASNRDTVDAMIENHINALFVSSVTMGMNAMLMAWIIFTLRVKDWATAREDRWKRLKIS